VHSRERVIVFRSRCVVSACDADNPTVVHVGDAVRVVKRDDKSSDNNHLEYAEPLSQAGLLTGTNAWLRDLTIP
jgi:hypothetical protein